MEEINYPNCEQGRFYKLIDSGYGYCTRFPPLNTLNVYKKKFLLIFKKRIFKNIIEFPVIPWTHRICGEFLKK